MATDSRFKLKPTLETISLLTQEPQTSAKHTQPRRHGTMRTGGIPWPTDVEQRVCHAISFYTARNPIIHARDHPWP